MDKLSITILGDFSCSRSPKKIASKSACLGSWQKSGTSYLIALPPIRTILNPSPYQVPLWQSWVTNAPCQPNHTPACRSPTSGHNRKSPSRPAEDVAGSGHLRFVGTFSINSIHHNPSQMTLVLLWSKYLIPICWRPTSWCLWSRWVNIGGALPPATRTELKIIFLAFRVFIVFDNCFKFGQWLWLTW